MNHDLHPPELNDRTQLLIKALKLTRHPEGGWFKETYRAALINDSNRAASTAIYFLLSACDISHFHRIDADEAWHHYEGDPIRVHILDDMGYRTLEIGPWSTEGIEPQGVVPAGAWFCAEVIRGHAGYALVGCTVAPGFEFASFELAKSDALIRQWPSNRELIERFTID